MRWQWCENGIGGCTYLNRHVQVLTALDSKSQVGAHGLVLSAVLLAVLLDAAIQTVWALGLADVTAVQQYPVVGLETQWGRNVSCQITLYIIWRFALR